MHNFRKLDIWTDSVELADTVYVMTDAFPKSEVSVLHRRCSVQLCPYRLT